MATSRSSKAVGSFICQSCRQRLLPINAPSRRPFTTTPSPRADSIFNSFSMAGQQAPRGRNGRDSTMSNQSITSLLDSDGDMNALNSWQNGPPDVHTAPLDPHRLHIYAHKHNTHITFVQPTKSAAQTTSSKISETSAAAADKKKVIDVLLSVSCGNIGFRHGARGSYDAAFQLASYTLKQISEKGMLRDVTDLEVVLRGFGQGREAVTKALMGTEGRFLRPYIKKVMDATRLKHGGTRSKKPRRLG